ncbi:MAG: Maf family protein [Candidatus Poseidoniaceae archaeon]
MGIWLASASERRAQILNDRIGPIHVEGLPDVDESHPSGSVPNQVLEICRRKSDAVPQNHGFQGVVVADTMIEDPDDPNVAIGKAEDEFSAVSMIKRLSGRRHQVWSATGVQICGDWTFFVESAVVEIDELNSDEIAHLIETESWKGKAGSYDLAGEMGKHARLVDGDELAVLGFAPSALRLLD